jgi:hypothetical protein
MFIIMVAGVLFGTILGRFFEVLILVPASVLSAVIVVVSTASADTGFWYSALEIGVVVISLQVGYIVGIVTGSDLLVERKFCAWEEHRPRAVSRSSHIH